MGVARCAMARRRSHSTQCCPTPFLPPFSLLMPAVWLKQDVQGSQWARHGSAPAAQRYLEGFDVKFWPEQIKRLAGRNAAKHGWRFSFNDPTSVPEVPSPARPPRPLGSSADGLPSVFQSPDQGCAVCDAKLAGHIRNCMACGTTTHELCGTNLPGGFSCYVCVCIACKADLVAPTETCSNCKLVVHQGCCLAISGCLLCRSCSPLAPKPTPPQPPAKRIPKGQWCIGRSWLVVAGGKMFCQACTAYPQPRVAQQWVDGTVQATIQAVKIHGASGQHAVSQAMWESGGKIKSAMATLPADLHVGVLNLFRAVYKIEKRGGSISDLSGDAQVEGSV